MQKENIELRSPKVQNLSLIHIFMTYPRYCHLFQDLY